MTTTNRPPTVDETAQCLLDGGVALLPTDTVYGLAVIPGRPSSSARVFELKGRPPSRNLPVMVASPDDLGALGVEISEAAKRLLHSGLMPGPVTLALGFGSGPRPSWLDGRIEVAVRIPRHEWLLELLRTTGPLLVTSANVHAQATRESVGGILEQLTERPDLVVDGGTLSVVPSTLVNCHAQPPVVEREGAVPASRIMAVIA
jgi:L-threonylcarbamoyladenylate synthase